LPTENSPGTIGACVRAMQADWEILNFHATLLHKALIVSFLKLYSAVVNFFLLYNVLTLDLPQEGTLRFVMGACPVLAVA